MPISERFFGAYNSACLHGFVLEQLSIILWRSPPKFDKIRFRGDRLGRRPMSAKVEEESGMAMAATDVLFQKKLERAKILAAGAHYEEALDILEGYLEEHLPAEATELIADLRARLAPQYTKRFPSYAVVYRKAAGAEALRSHQLRAKHAYLWSLCGDGTSIDDLLSLSPLHPLDSLRTLAKLSDLGLVIEKR
jgi:hypothetical protein